MVIIGVETSELFNCGLKDHCTQETIEQQLQELYASGVRSLFPVHKFDNQLSGSRVEDELINFGQWFSTSYFFETQECDAHTHGANMTSGFPILSDIPILGDIVNSLPDSPVYDENIKHCNQHGLSELGVYLVNRMIDLGMLNPFSLIRL
jgi:hypothetical protein